MKTNCVKHLLLFSLPYCGVAPSCAQTLLSGVIGSNTTLTLADSPYLVTGNLLVAENVQLTVEPGVVVRFEDFELLLRGPLVAHGNATDSIVFEGVTSSIDGWEGIRIDNYQGAKVDLSYFHGRYAHKLLQDDRAIGTDTVITVVHSTLENNTYVLDVNSAYGSTRRYFDHCILSNNSTNCPVGAGSIFKNTVFSNGSVGVRNFYSGAMLTLVDSCTFVNLDYVAVGEKVHVTNSTLYQNDIAIEFDYFTQVHGCTIFENSRGIHVGMNVINNTNTVSQNTICDNGFNIELMYGADFFAPNNCWCLNDSADIRQTMRDFFSTTGLGIVHYTPFDTNCALQTQVEVFEQGLLDLLLYPNPNNGRFFVEFPDPTMAATYYSVHDALGKLLYRRPLALGTRIEEIDLSRYGSGTYMIKFTDRDGVRYERLLLQ